MKQPIAYRQSIGSTLVTVVLAFLVYSLLVAVGIRIAGVEAPFSRIWTLVLMLAWPIFLIIQWPVSLFTDWRAAKKNCPEKKKFKMYALAPTITVALLALLAEWQGWSWVIVTLLGTLIGLIHWQTRSFVIYIEEKRLNKGGATSD